MTPNEPNLGLLAVIPQLRKLGAPRLIFNGNEFTLPVEAQALRAIHPLLDHIASAARWAGNEADWVKLRGVLEEIADGVETAIHEWRTMSWLSRTP